MGEFFMMSNRFDKSSSSDFSLISTEKVDVFKLVEDNSLWEKCELYDFGWGNENGYRKIPILSFAQLVDLAMNSTNNDDKFGAAAQLLSEHTFELMEFCFNIVKGDLINKKYIEFFRLLKLHIPTNRWEVIGKTIKEIEADAQKWLEISKALTNRD